MAASCTLVVGPRSVRRRRVHRRSLMRKLMPPPHRPKCNNRASMERKTDGMVVVSLGAPNAKGALCKCEGAQLLMRANDAMAATRHRRKTQRAEENNIERTCHSACALAHPGRGISRQFPPSSQPAWPRPSRILGIAFAAPGLVDPSFQGRGGGLRQRGQSRPDLAIGPARVMTDKALFSGFCRCPRPLAMLKSSGRQPVNTRRRFMEAKLAPQTRNGRARCRH